MNTDLHKGATQYVGILNGRLVCHTGVIQFPLRKGQKRVHRLVVLPDYQGIGIGTKFIDAIGEIVSRQGFELNLTTTTPSLLYSLLKDNNWILARYGREKSGMNGYQRYGKQMAHLKNTVSCNRVTYSFWYRAQGYDKKTVENKD